MNSTLLKPQTFRENIILFGAIPPPYSGAAISNQVVYNLLIEEYNVFRLETSIGSNKLKNDFINNVKYVYLTLILYLKNIFLLARILRKNKIYAFYFLPSCNLLGHIKDSILLFLFGNKFGKIIGQVHNSNFTNLFEKKIYKLVTKCFYKKISNIIVSSKSLALELDENNLTSKISYFSNTINPKIFCTNIEVNLKFRLKSSSTSIRILFVGHMMFSKGCFDLLKAASILKSSGKSNFKVCFIGGWIDVREKNEFNTFILNNNMEDYVECLGIIKDPSILKKEYLKSNIFALPTFYPYESQPLAIIDAMNAGNPIISTNHGTISDFIKSDINGYIVDKHNPKQICDSILKLMDQDIWIKLAKQSRKDFENKFSLELYKSNLLTVFK